MDGDLQHDEGILPAMLEKIRNETSTRGGHPQRSGWRHGEFSRHRRAVEPIGTRLSQAVSHTD